MFGILTRIRLIRYGIKRDSIYYSVRRPYGVLYHTGKHQIIETIHEEHQYDSLDVKGRQVVDIGADCGDTALQFAYKGAKDVYAYEPNINSIKTLDLTLAKNPHKNIKSFNKAVTGKEGYTYIDASAVPDRGSPLSKGTFQIETTTLDNIVKEHKIINGILKMDCEGSEYNIIDNATDKTLLAFKEMAIELHYKGEGNIVSRLRKLGYKIEMPKHTGRLQKLLHRIETTENMKNDVYMIFAVQTDD